jgi:hypothetical protein
LKNNRRLKVVYARALSAGRSNVRDRQRQASRRGGFSKIE